MAPGLVGFTLNPQPCTGRHSSRQHVPVAEYRENLQRMVAAIRGEHGIHRIILITPPPVYEPARKEWQIQVGQEAGGLLLLYLNYLTASRANYLADLTPREQTIWLT